MLITFKRRMITDWNLFCPAFKYFFNLPIGLNSILSHLTGFVCVENGLGFIFWSKACPQITSVFIQDNQLEIMVLQSHLARATYWLSVIEISFCLTSAT